MASRVIRLFKRLRPNDEQKKIKEIWFAFGFDYEAEKQKLDEIWRHLAEGEESVGIHKKHRGEGGRMLDLSRKFLQALMAIDSQATREQAVKRLEELAKIAHRYAKDRHLKVTHRLKWARIEAYIYQVINGILKDYDAVKIAEKIEKLKQLVENELGKRAGTA